MFATLCYTNGMASHYVRERSPYYWIRFRRVDGSWACRSSGIKIEAKGNLRKISQMVAEATAKESFETEDGATAMFSRWVPGWIGYKYTNRFSAARCRNAWAHISVFFKARRVLHPAEVNYVLCHDYVQWRTSKEESEKEGRKPAAWNTAVMEMRVMGAIMQESLRRGWVMANPCARLGMGKRDTREKRAISKAEEKWIFEEMERREKNAWMPEMFLVAMRQGCRMREVEVPMHLIDTKAMVITFKVKGGGMHAAPLHKDLLPLVKLARKEKRKVLVPLPAQPSPRWGEFFEAIGLEGLCFHCTRVTVVTRLCEAGFSESQTMAYVGHSSELVHALYRKMRPSAVAKLGDVL